MEDLNALARFEASKDLLAVERVQARKRKSPPCFWEREDVTPGAT